MRRPGEGGGTHTHGRSCKLPSGYREAHRGCGCKHDNHKLRDAELVRCAINGCNVPVGRKCPECGLVY